MTTITEVQRWQGQEVRGPDGEKIGTLENVYVDRQSGEPTFASVKTGLFGMRSNLVPVDALSDGGGELRASVDKATIKDAPNVDADEELTPEEEQRLYTYYNREYTSWEGDGSDITDRSRSRSRSREPGGPGHDTSGPNTDDAMTRSEEELRVGKTAHETGRARLRKYVVTELVQKTVPVQREEVRVEREPITEANAPKARRGPAISEEEHEVTLRAEEPVVEKRAVPKERVRLEKDTWTEDVDVSDEVRKERIDVDDEPR